MKSNISPYIQELKTLYINENRRKFPSLPESCRVTPKYEDKTANGLTKIIIDYLRFAGHQVERISVTGRYKDQSTVVIDVLGHSPRIGSRCWLKSSMQKGSSDISATIFGRSVKIEVKIGLDRQSEVQMRYQEQIERAGGIYLICRSFAEFKSWYQQFANNGNS